MAKRWTPDEDQNLVKYGEAVPNRWIADDTGRTEAAVRVHIEKLKATGAWDAYRQAEEKLTEAMRLAGHNTYWREDF